jgi:hypothetical protein
MNGTLSRVHVRHAILVLLTAAALAASRPARGVGAIVGGTIIAGSTLLNTLSFHFAVRRPNPRVAIGISSVKLLASLLLVWWVMTYAGWRPDPVGFAIGVACFPVAALWDALRTNTKVT